MIYSMLALFIVTNAMIWCVPMILRIDIIKKYKGRKVVAETRRVKSLDDVKYVIENCLDRGFVEFRIKKELEDWEKDMTL